MKRTVFYDGLYGLAVADALGVPFESEKLTDMRERPCTDMTGFGHHNQPAGSWSDDTSMTLCVADSLCRGFDLDDMMKKFSQWRSKHSYTANGVVFDIGRCCRRAINQYWDGMPAEFCGDSSLHGNGNGALMRMLPIALYQCHCSTADDAHLEAFLTPIHAASSITHAHEIGLICCGLFSLTIREWLQHEGSGTSLLDIARSAFEKGKQTYAQMGGNFTVYINDPAYFDDPGNLTEKMPEELPSWGYALNTWNIALWSLLTTDNYRDCVLKAVNLGGDADTNAAVAGALAGVIYGKEAIPHEWMDALLNKPLLDEIAEKFTRMLFGMAEKTLIDQFDGPYAFMSMKAPASVVLDGICYKDVGEAFYALNVPREYRSQFAQLGARRARKLFKQLPHLENSAELVVGRLYRAVEAKYTQHPEDREKLLDTGKMEIIYDTSGSHDNVLGRCRCTDCRGKEYENLYGKVLMRVREELQAQKSL